MAPEEIQFIVLADLASLVVFSGFVTWGLAWRRRREWHRRLTAAASIMIVGPAVARLAHVGLPAPVPAVLVALLVALAVNDEVEMGRLHRATVAGASLLPGTLAIVLLVVGTPTTEEMIHWLNPQR